MSEALVPYAYDSGSGAIVKVTEVPASAPAEYKPYSTASSPGREIAPTDQGSSRYTAALLPNGDINPAWARSLVNPGALTKQNRADIPTVPEFMRELHAADPEVYEELVSSTVRQYGHLYGVKTALSESDLDQIDYRYWEVAATLPQEQVT